MSVRRPSSCLSVCVCTQSPGETCQNYFTDLLFRKQVLKTRVDRSHKSEVGKCAPTVALLGRKTTIITAGPCEFVRVDYPVVEGG